MRVQLWLLGALIMVANCVLAHDPGLSTATAQLSQTKLEVLLVFSTADIAALADPGQQLKVENSQDKLPQSAAALQKQAASALAVSMDDRPILPNETRCRFDEKQNASIYLSFPASSCSKLFVKSKWLALLPPGHREFFSLQDADGKVLAERLLSANADSVTIEPSSANKKTAEHSTRNSFADFLLLGVKHIWTGYDHLLFLFGLLIVTRNFASSIKIITCFTLAHSVTLALATLSVVQISSRFVEPLIAASIAYVGIENLFRGDEPRGRWLLTFAFGLIHGFGFATVLRELGVGAGGSSIAVPLVSFNLGVELGQIVVAAAVLPVIWKLQVQPVFLRRWVPACSAMVALLGGYWFVQRVWF